MRMTAAADHSPGVVAEDRSSPQPFQEPVRHADVRRIVAEHGQFVWRTARYLGVAEQDLDDVAQEVFVVVHRRLVDFDGRSSLKTWIYGICIRVAAAYRRRARRRREVVVESPPEQRGSDDPEVSFERRQARALVQQALDRLDEDKRAVFVLFELEQLEMADVAAVVGCARKTAYSRLYAARREVLRFLERAAQAGDP